MASGTTRPPSRLPTVQGGPDRPAPPASIQALAAVIASMERELWDLSRASASSAKRGDEVHDMLIELVGRDGRAGVVREMREAQARSAESQGRRLGEVEGRLSAVEAAQAAQATAQALTKWQLGAAGTVGLLVVAAAVKVLLGGA